MRRTLAIAVALAALTTGCRPPHAPVEIGVQEVGSDIVLGRRPAPPLAPAPAPIPPLTLVAALPAIAPTFPPSRPTEDVTPPAPACPEADPFAAPKVVAPNAPSNPPAAAPYTYRNDGTYEVRGPDTRQGRFPPTSVREIHDVVRTGDGFRYSVSVNVLGVTTDTAYHAVTSPAAAAVQPAGLFVVSVVSTTSDGRTSRFVPVPEMELLPFPAVPGTTFSVNSVNSNVADPGSFMAMRYTGTVGQKARIDACGEPLEAVTVDITNGTVTSASTNETFSASYAFAPQYGAIAVADTVSVSGTEGPDSVSRANRAVINEVPHEVMP